MDTFFFIATLILIFIGAPVGIGLFIYWAIKSSGHPKVAKLITLVYGLFILIIATLIYFDDELFTKSEAKRYLAEHKFELNENFEILNNKSGGLTDYYHVFELEITKNEKEKFINQIKLNENFTKGISDDFYLPAKLNRYLGKPIISCYENKLYFKFEYFKPNGQGAAPTYNIITISKKKNWLMYENIID